MRTGGPARGRAGNRLLDPKPLIALHWPALNNPDMPDEPHRAPETNDASLTPHGESPRGRKESAFANWIAAHEVALRWGIWVVVGASIAIGTFMWMTGRLDVQTVGYAGAFAVNLAGSASIFIPVPGLAVICGASAGGADLNPVLLGLAGAIGATIGESAATWRGIPARCLSGGRSDTLVSVIGWTETGSCRCLCWQPFPTHSLILWE